MAFAGERWVGSCARARVGGNERLHTRVVLIKLIKVHRKFLVDILLVAIFRNKSSLENRSSISHL
jgi:hypothetical protein